MKEISQWLSEGGTVFGRTCLWKLQPFLVHKLKIGLMKWLMKVGNLGLIITSDVTCHTRC